MKKEKALIFESHFKEGFYLLFNHEFVMHVLNFQDIKSC